MQFRYRHLSMSCDFKTSVGAKKLWLQPLKHAFLCNFTNLSCVHVETTVFSVMNGVVFTTACHVFEPVSTSHVLNTLNSAAYLYKWHLHTTCPRSPCKLKVEKSIFRVSWDQAEFSVSNCMKLWMNMRPHHSHYSGYSYNVIENNTANNTVVTHNFLGWPHKTDTN